MGLTFTSLIAANTRATYSALMKELSGYLLCGTYNDGNFRILKSDLWNESIDNSKGNLREFVSNLPFGLETFGGDISSKICRLASEKRIIDNIVCFDVMCLPFRSNSLDIVFDLSTIDHVEPSSTQKVIKEYSRVLRSGGLLLLTFDSLSILSKLQRAISRMIAPDRAKLGYAPYHWLIHPIIMRNILKEYYGIISEYSLLPEHGILMLLQRMFTKVNNQRLRIGPSSWRFMFTLLQNFRRFELSRCSKHMEVLAFQYVFLCVRA